RPVAVRWTRPTILSSEVRANESRHHHPARAPGHRAAARALAHGHLQRAGGCREPLQERLRPDRRAAQTPLLADPEPGRSRQGLLRGDAALTGLGGVVTARPFTAGAQPGEQPRRVSLLMSLAENDPEAQARVAVLTRGLRDLGWAEGRNLRVENRGIVG